MKKLICLSKLTGSSFDEEKDHWMPKTGSMPVPIKIVDRTLFDETKSAISSFNKGVERMGKITAILGPLGDAVNNAIGGLADTVEGIIGLTAVSFCKDRDFILVLDEMFAGGKAIMDPTTGQSFLRVYALTPPE